MKKYFKVARVEDEAKQDAIIMYLTYDAVLGGANMMKLKGDSTQSTHGMTSRGS